jgi:RNA polymerase sigma-70 factor, ECF subfamily
MFMRGDELSLVEAAQVGDVDALDELMTHYRGKVISMVRSILGNCHDAEDACQEALLAASQGLSKLQSRDKFGSWLLGIAYRKAKDIQRRQFREQNARETLPNPVMRLTEVDRTDLNLTIFEVLSDLPEDQRVVLNLRYHNGLRYNEIAELMAVPVSTIRGAIYRGTKALREALKTSFENQGS